MQFIAIIPARYASSRFPGKPLADIAGKPMIRHVYERVASIVPCVVATDDERIRQCVQGFGGRVVMTSADHRSGTDRCREALDRIEKQENCIYDVVLNIQGDEPFVSRQHIERIISPFADPEVCISTLVKRFSSEEDIFDENTPKVVLDRHGNAIYFSRNAVPFRRSVEPSLWQAGFPYFKHIGMYAYRADILRRITEMEPGMLELAESLEQLRWLENGIGIRAVETDVETASVDTSEDLEKILAEIAAGKLTI